MPKMTRYERISIILAVIALVLAIASPIVTYHWFDPQILAFKRRARLQVSANFQLKQSPIVDKIPPDPHGFQHFYIFEEGCDVTILNVGDLPAKDILVVVDYPKYLEKISDPTFDPPLPSEVNVKNNTQYIIIKRPLPQNDKIVVTFFTAPRSISVSNEYGETTTILTASIREQQPPK